jgi:two-component system, OmpR family, KDP operon response regulator KdpE
MPGVTQDPVIEANGLTIDLAAHRVSRDGEDLHLSKTEFELLRVLAANRGRLMTHRALLTEVWGPGYATDTQVLRTTVARLRSRVGKDVIHTDPGVGYRIDA